MADQPSGDPDLIAELERSLATARDQQELLRRALDRISDVLDRRPRPPG